MSAAPELLTAKQVAERLQLSIWTLRNWRRDRKGPKYLRLGRAVRYRLEDIIAWENTSAQDFS